MKDVAGKVALVTGGASGIGLAMVRAFTGAGMKVAIADIEQDAITTALEEFSDSNTEVIGIKVDVNDRSEMEAAADETQAAFGGVHVLCNNAGVAVGGSIETMSYKDWDWVMNVNLQGVINGVQVFLPRMISQGEPAHIVNTASMAGQFPVPGLSVYNTTKYAVVGMSETMRIDLANKGIGVSVLCPGVVNTNIGNSGRNRPANLVGESQTDMNVLVDDSLPDDERMARMAEIMAGGIDAGIVGDMVLQAVLQDDLYIFPHPEIRVEVERRMQAMMDSFARWQAYRDDH
ncbi:MAG: SDR family NAD(P)-dependent oxidoreductase [bacterium]|nr:SDR family NAD(P)-dependent oxidoreductase [Gammaproteobacteria bacterium]